MRDDSIYARIYDVVRRVPRGKVTTYGEVAKLAGIPGHARQVGYALNALPEDLDVPWQRVINARGEISLRSTPGGWGNYQRQLLEAEGIVFDSAGRISLERFGWRGNTGRGRQVRSYARERVASSSRR